MTPLGHTGRRRIRTLGLVTLPLAIAGWLGAGAAMGAGSSGPTMEVLPKPTGLKYSQTVEIKGHHLPKGSGSVAATICGLTYPSGSTIANPGADDCAGAEAIGKLVIVKSWQSNGEFDTQYTLPKSGQKFGKNARYCDKTHKCALVVADANPDNPAYHVETRILFTDQASTTTTTKPKTTTTTKPKRGGGTQPKPANTTTTTEPKSTTTQPESPATDDTQPKTTTTAGATAGGGSNSGSNSGSVKAGVSITIEVPAGGAPPAPPLPPGLDQVCTQLGDAVKQAGGDPSAISTVCSAVASGNGPAQLQVVLQSPSLLCIQGASLWQHNQQITDACNQAAAALAPVTAVVGGALAPILGKL